MVLGTYVVKEHLLPILFAFSVIMFLLVLDTILQAADLMLGRGVSLRVAGELFFLHTAWQVALAAPMSILVGSLMAFGRLSADNEITAMRALGVSFHQLIWPALGLATLMALALVWFNDRILPDFNHKARLLVMDIHRKRPTVSLEGREGVFIQDFSNYHILIGEIDGESSTLRDVLIYKYDASGYPTTIRADSGQLTFAENRDEALLTLHSGSIDRVDEASPDLYVSGSFGTLTLQLGEAGRRLSRTVSSYRNDREMRVATMWDRVADHDRGAAALEAEGVGRWRAFVARALLGIESENTLTGAPRSPGGFSDFRFVASRARADATLAAHKRRQADRLRVEVHKKFSIPAACLVFVLIAAPVGFMVRRGGPTVAAAISIAFFLVYWLFLIGGEKLADRGFIAPWFAMWSPNLLIGTVGLLMLYRLARRPG